MIQCCDNTQYVECLVQMTLTSYSAQDKTLTYREYGT